MMDSGVQVALGGDGYTYDLFAELGSATILQRLRQGDPSAFSAKKQIVDLVYSNNGRLAKNVFGYTVGTIEPGAAADFLILDYDPPPPLAEENLMSHLAGGCGGHVQDVIVDGETVVENHKCTRVDEPRFLPDAASRRRDFGSSCVE
jgi:cytosine/adenosine deaminase-related metal-dependent hydrolase